RVGAHEHGARLQRRPHARARMTRAAIASRHAAPSISVSPIAGALGAEISGVDLATPLSDEVVSEIRQAWLDHLVVFFRDQRLEPAQFLAFARRIGEPVEYPIVKGIEGYPEIIAVRS